MQSLANLSNIASLGAGNKASFKLSKLFKAGEQGVWYDPTDMSTLFQDIEGTTPVSAMEQSVGLVLDKRTPELSWKLSQRLGAQTEVRCLVSLGNGIVIAGTGNTGQIYRSTDSGESWSNVQRLGSETQVYSLTSLGNGIVIAGTAETGQVWRSTNSGESWSLVGRLGSESRIFSLTSLGNGIVIAGTGNTGQIYRSTDSGESWSLVQRLGSEQYVWSLTSLGNGIVLAGTFPTGQVYRSTDSGESWSNIQRLGSEQYVLSFASLGNGIVLAGTLPTGQIYRSINSGESWSNIQRLGSETHVYSLTSLGNGIALAGTLPTGQVWRSTNSGQSWSLVQRLGSETYVLSLTSLGNGIVLAGTATTGQVWRSTNDSPPNNHAFQPTSASRPKVSARYNMLVGTETLATQNVTTVAQSYTLSFEGTGDIQLSGTSSELLEGTGTERVQVVFTPSAGTLTLTVSGAVEKASLLPSDLGHLPYQNVVSETVYTTGASFPSYLKFDGVDDFLRSTPVDFSAGDELSVFAGVRKERDTTKSVIAESGTTGQNFSLLAPGANGVASFGSGLNTEASTATLSGQTAPKSAVLTSLLDRGQTLPADENKLRIKGGEYQAGAGTGVTGNFASGHDIFLGMRAGTTLAFNGSIGQVVVRAGIPIEPTIKKVEKVISKKIV